MSHSRTKPTCHWVALKLILVDDEGLARADAPCTRIEVCLTLRVVTSYGSGSISPDQSENPKCLMQGVSVAMGENWACAS
jgi:hypothetical protein